MSIVGLKKCVFFAANLIRKTMLNRQLTMGNSKDNMMASDARRTFAAEN